MILIMEDEKKKSIFIAKDETDDNKIGNNKYVVKILMALTVESRKIL